MVVAQQILITDLDLSGKGLRVEFAFHSGGVACLGVGNNLAVEDWRALTVRLVPEPGTDGAPPPSPIIIKCLGVSSGPLLSSPLLPIPLPPSYSSGCF